MKNKEITNFNVNKILQTELPVIMKLNTNTKMISQKIILVPYQAHHVPKYHQWLKSDELQRLTASEPLTLEEEYEMQKSWIEDENKCTFIILEKEAYQEKQNEIGDTNIFITDKEANTGEIEIMIAEDSARGKKLGWEAVILMLLYGITHINLKTYEAKISLTNEISLGMFKKLGFEEKSRSDVFHEITLEKKVSDEWKEWLAKHVQYVIESC
ncbi:N-acetyltransferase 9 isoform X2 [Hyposmocoma kahamanoa]|uniref:N-acetyltransferase 9 isoform X2 n=1 Tax=Hyposmocoma kahamanoa TaxID=1477025 RepID=UPI000E6D9CB2|nr:N-acetyltransferase 9 isoform X2 [Hyposmocoma kahamanoa]